MLDMREAWGYLILFGDRAEFETIIVYIKCLNSGKIYGDDSE